ncbi:MAG: hypothetical protein BWZ10_00543 [candidate division BRC1 bacterium ADurb.BinA364]|nr:MAG: hypothetical protein BWZ10_00543 [candidate division BRC1 bacterium ADurb.BinA364]
MPVVAELAGQFDERTVGVADFQAARARLSFRRPILVGASGVQHAANARGDDGIIREFVLELFVVVVVLFAGVVLVEVRRNISDAGAVIVAEVFASRHADFGHQPDFVLVVAPAAEERLEQRDHQVRAVFAQEAVVIGDFAGDGVGSDQDARAQIAGVAEEVSLGVFAEDEHTGGVAESDAEDDASGDAFLDGDHQVAHAFVFRRLAVRLDGIEDAQPLQPVDGFFFEILAIDLAGAQFHFALERFAFDRRRDFAVGAPEDAHIFQFFDVVGIAIDDDIADADALPFDDFDGDGHFGGGAVEVVGFAGFGQQKSFVEVKRFEFLQRGGHFLAVVRFAGHAFERLLHFGLRENGRAFDGDGAHGVARPFVDHDDGSDFFFAFVIQEFAGRDDGVEESPGLVEAFDGLQILLEGEFVEIVAENEPGAFVVHRPANSGFRNIRGAADVDVFDF